MRVLLALVLWAFLGAECARAAHDIGCEDCCETASGHFSGSPKGLKVSQ
jgi:hypothetical protein